MNAAVEKLPKSGVDAGELEDDHGFHIDPIANSKNMKATISNAINPLFMSLLPFM